MKQNFWENINSIQARQTAKGIATYGQTLEENTDLSDIQMLTMLEEELIDGLMYLEGLKYKLMSMHERMGMFDDDGK